MVKHIGFFGWIIVLGLFSYAYADETDQLRQRVMDYVESIETLEADFKETGTERAATGKVFLKRPARGENTFGKLKFTYNPPVLLEIVSRDGTIYVANNKTKTMDTTPLSSTPLLVLLRSKVKLDDTVIEKELEDKGNVIHWTLAQAEETGAESPDITLIFKKAPLVLDGWIVHDLAGDDTTVQLGTLKTGHPLREDLFKKPVIAEN